MHQNKLFRTIAVIVVLVGCIALVQVSAAVYFSLAEMPLTKADIAIVFPGEAARVKTGFQVVRDGFAANLMVVNTPSEKLQSLMRKEGVPEEVTALPGGVSRSSFEDVYQSARAIKNHEFTSVILITSSYHLPRAYVLLKWYLAGTGKTISIQCYPAAEQHNITRLSRKVLVYYNEAVKLWGSSAEMLGYFLTKQLPLDSPDTYRLRTFFKTHFLFEA
jgi:hypothetical protein